MSEWWEGKFDERMARRAERRAAEQADLPEWLRDTPAEIAAREQRRFEQLRGDYILLPQGRRRPSDGKPSGSKEFDFDEYETRKADRRAADPEAFQRERAAQRRQREEMGQRWREQHEFDNCNAALKAERLERERRYPGNHRLLDIWQWIINAEQAEKIDRLYLRQEDRIANSKRLRVRGCGRAAKRAGF